MRQSPCATVTAWLGRKVWPADIRLRFARPNGGTGTPKAEHSLTNSA
jgi:hypothetical protein